MSKTTFRVGDHVRLRRGYTRMRVIAATQGDPKDLQMIRTIYAHEEDRREVESLPVRWRKASDYFPWDGQPGARTLSREDRLTAYDTPLREPDNHLELEDDQQETEDMTTKLYQTTDKTPRFGTYLAKTAEGQIVLEMKGENGKVEAFDPEHIEEVVPYTIRVRGVTDNHYTAHYAIGKDIVEVGDLIASNSGNLYVVTELNTKCKTPKGEFKGAVYTADTRIG